MKFLIRALAFLFLTTPAMAQQGWPTPDGRNTVTGLVGLCANGSSQAVTCDSAAVTGSVTSQATLFTADMTGFNSLSVAITANASGNTITFETSDDNTNWIAAAGISAGVNGVWTSSTATTTVGTLLRFPVYGRYFRARVSTYISGTTTVVGNMHSSTFTNYPGSTQLQGVGNGVYIGDTRVSPTSNSGNGITAVVSASAENNHVLKASAGVLYSVYATNLTATAGFLVILNATSAPGDGAITPLACVPLAGNSFASINYNPGPMQVYSTGMTAVLTSAATCFTKTTGVITGFISGNVQ